MYTLYFAPDNASLVVRIVLEEIGAQYSTRLVDRQSHEQSGETYRKLNPNGLIPVCIIDGEPVFETAAILLTLADRHGKLAPPPLSRQRPGFLKWLFFLSNTVHPDLRQLFYPTQYTAAEPHHVKAFSTVTRERLRRHFAILEELYGGLNTPYLLGDEPTIMDIYAAMCLRWSQIYPLGEPPAFTPSLYPALHAFLTVLQARPAMKRAFEAEGIPAPYLTGAQQPDGSVGAAL